MTDFCFGDIFHISQITELDIMSIYFRDEIDGNFITF